MPNYSKIPIFYAPKNSDYKELFFSLWAKGYRRGHDVASLDGEWKKIMQYCLADYFLYVRTDKIIGFNGIYTIKSHMHVRLNSAKHFLDYAEKYVNLA